MYEHSGEIMQNIVALNFFLLFLLYVIAMTD